VQYVKVFITVSAEQVFVGLAIFPNSISRNDTTQGRRKLRQYFMNCSEFGGATNRSNVFLSYYICYN
jgi:hypothetical protein